VNKFCLELFRKIPLDRKKFQMQRTKSPSRERRRKLASYEVAGDREIKLFRPARDGGNSNVPSGRGLFCAKRQPLAWLANFQSPFRDKIPLDRKIFEAQYLLNETKS
jgi:hypothetical protein